MRAPVHFTYANRPIVYDAMAICACWGCDDKQSRIELPADPESTVRRVDGTLDETLAKIAAAVEKYERRIDAKASKTP